MEEKPSTSNSQTVIEEVIVQLYRFKLIRQ